VQNGIGLVSSGQSNTVAALRTSYTDVEDLLAAMLKIAPMPAYTLQASPPAISFSVDPQIGVEMGVFTEVTFQRSDDLGRWQGGVTLDAHGQPAPSAPAYYAYSDPIIYADGGALLMVH
jgi:hypothetical protein